MRAAAAAAAAIGLNSEVYILRRGGVSKGPFTDVGGISI
jgi:hypothetical protein